MPRLGHKNVDDALAAIGRGELSAVDVLKAMGLTLDDTQAQGAAPQGPVAEDGRGR